MCPTMSVRLCELSLLRAFMYLRSERNARKCIQPDSVSAKIFTGGAEVTDFCVVVATQKSHSGFFICLPLLCMHHHSLLAFVSS